MCKSLCGICECLQGLTDCICECCGDDNNSDETEKIDTFSSNSGLLDMESSEAKIVPITKTYVDGNCFSFAFGLYNKALEIEGSRFECSLASGVKGDDMSGQSIWDNLKKAEIDLNDNEIVKKKLIYLINNYFNERSSVKIQIKKIDEISQSKSQWIVCVLYSPVRGHHYLRSNDWGETWYFKDGNGSNCLSKLKSNNVKTNSKYPNFVCFFEVTLKH